MIRLTPLEKTVAVQELMQISHVQGKQVRFQPVPAA